MKKHIKSPPSTPSPSSPPIPWALWVILAASVITATPTLACNTEGRHCGDLHLTRGPNIHSLAWVVEVREGCHIAQVLTDFKAKTKEREDTETEHCGRDGESILNLIILLKQLSPFENVYLVAHPFFRLFSMYQKRTRRHQRRVKHSIHSSIVRNATLTTLATLSPVKPLDREGTFLKVERCVGSFLRLHPCLAYAHQEVLRPRKKRRGVEFADPLYKDQWHLSGITGRGVTVCVIDDGLEWRHPDLRNNYSPAGSYDLNSDDPDPSPVKNGERNEHGTRCAGEIAAVANSVCGVGVAFHANISGVRVLGERMTDSMEAAAFVQGLAVNDIYSCSWGPDDDGRTVDGPHHLARRALVHGVTYGRGGYGAVYVVASGNGGRNKDNCNFDGYANSVYTVTIGAMDSHGRMPYYSEECAAMLAVTPSSGTKGRDIVTTDWREISESGCTKHHSGTSAAAPLAAAVIALALEVQPCLSWRDVQHLIALTSKKIDTNNPDWSTNGAGLHHSHQHGFGLMDAAAMVSSAAVWESVPFSTSYSTRPMVEDVDIPAERLRGVTVKCEVDRRTLRNYALTTLEFVQVRVTVQHQYRGSLRVVLVCPSGTRSTLAAPREADNSTKGLTDWALGTVRCWGEDPAGVYQVTVTQTRHQRLTGRLLSWRLVLHGSPMALQDFQGRRRLVERARRGEVIHVNRSTLCHPPELRFKPFHPLPEKWLKVLAVTSLFLMVMIGFNTLEYIFCYNDEKEKFYRRLRDVATGRALQNRRNASSTLRAPPTDMAGYGRATGGRDGDRDTQRSVQSSSYEILPLMGDGRRHTALVSPSPSCDADVSGDDDSDDDNISSSHCTSDTVLPKDTDATDFTNDEFMSELDEEKGGGGGGFGGGGGLLLLGGCVKQDDEEVVVYAQNSYSDDEMFERRDLMHVDWTER
ncbi:Proprotein convertase subtilisin/kexin type 7 [Chionoecetes opilio]|uniref:Proprotein convertase subtilisin/kexin type 7 n=1 Tax=Chionoecetes opilio TaxID=41210 RepID=A0A8J4YB03_CHIOP|nr:Proprotein convertase subtilisin/kexin type 7 [Chionoecetes opilio]